MARRSRTPCRAARRCPGPPAPATLRGSSCRRLRDFRSAPCSAHWRCRTDAHLPPSTAIATGACRMMSRSRASAIAEASLAARSRRSISRSVTSRRVRGIPAGRPIPSRSRAFRPAGSAAVRRRCRLRLSRRRSVGNRTGFPGARMAAMKHPFPPRIRILDDAIVPDDDDGVTIVVDDVPEALLRSPRAPPHTPRYAAAPPREVCLRRVRIPSSSGCEARPWVSPNCIGFLASVIGRRRGRTPPTRARPVPLQPDVRPVLLRPAALGAGTFGGLPARRSALRDPPMSVPGRPGDRCTGAPARMPVTLRKRSPDVHAVPVDRELADVLVVHRAAHLEHRQAAPHLAEHLDVAQQDDRVGERRDVALGDRRCRPCSDGVVEVNSPVISCCLMNDVRPITNSRKPSASPTRSSADRLSTATRSGLNSSMIDLDRDQVVLEPRDSG